MHLTEKGNPWYHRCAAGFAYGIKVLTGVDKDNGLIHSVQTTTANVHDLSPAAERPHGIVGVEGVGEGRQNHQVEEMPLA
jgi:IS5 family transposase